MGECIYVPADEEAERNSALSFPCDDEHLIDQHVSSFGVSTSASFFLIFLQTLCDR